MTRLKISFCILALLVSIAVFSGTWIKHSCNSILSGISAVSSYSENGDTSSAIDSSRRLEEEWGRFRRKAELLLNNAKLTEIDRVCARVVYLAENESPELESGLDELRHLLADLMNSC